MLLHTQKTEQSKSVTWRDHVFYPTKPTLIHRLQRALRELNKVVDSAASVVTGGGVNSGSRLNLTSSQVPIVDRALGEISRSFVSKDDQVCFCQLGGIASVLKMLMLSCGDCIGGGGIGGGKWSLSEK